MVIFNILIVMWSRPSWYWTSLCCRLGGILATAIVMLFLSFYEHHPHFYRIRQFAILAFNQCGGRCCSTCCCASHCSPSAILNAFMVNVHVISNVSDWCHCFFGVTKNLQYFQLVTVIIPIFLFFFGFPTILSVVLDFMFANEHVCSNEYFRSMVWVDHMSGLSISGGMRCSSLYRNCSGDNRLLPL